MIGEQITCQREGCDEEFVKRTHNQIYHDANCTKLATNVNIMKKYYRRRAQRLGHARYCSSCETTKLSRYNPDTVCNSCSQKQEIELNQSVSNSLMAVNWLS